MFYHGSHTITFFPNFLYVVNLFPKYPVLPVQFESAGSDSLLVILILGGEFI